jgi:PAS domain S-box-containing protein
MLSHEPGSPSPQHQNTIEQVTHIASIAIERTRAEDRLRRSEAFLAEGQRISHTGSWGWVLSTGRVTWSEEQYRMLGFKPGETEPSVDRFLTAAHPEDRSRVQQNLEVAIKEGRNYAVDYRVVLPNGSVRNMRSVGRPVVAEGGSSVEEYIGVTMDITERVQAEAALRRAQRLEATGTLAGGVAHDFNNILGAILGYGEMALRDAPKGSRLRRDLDSIMSAGERGRALVDRILTFSRSGVGERVAVHVEKVVREALDLLSAKLSDGVRVDMRLHAGRAAMMGDPTQVHQVVMNLATNAVQAMNAGGTLRVSLEVMAVNTRRVATIGEITAAEYIVLQVADDGAGIPPEILDRIFDPFFTTKEVSVGTGLGLSLVHGIVTEVGGAIDVASERGTGSTFTVYLPRTGDAHDAREDLPSTMPRGDRQRVLVVDDEEPLVRLTTETLQELGYVPVGFTSSAAALDAFRADPKTFDAVITDERMPGISGSALIREMRGIRRSIPILLVSGYVGGMVMGRAYNSGANEVLKKPLSAHELATSLARILHLQ